MLVDELARQVGAPLDKLQHNAAVGRGRFCGKRVLLAKPMTFMNNSGESVGKLARYFKVSCCHEFSLSDCCKWGCALCTSLGRCKRVMGVFLCTPGFGLLFQSCLPSPDNGSSGEGVVRKIGVVEFFDVILVRVTVWLCIR